MNNKQTNKTKNPTQTNKKQQQQQRKQARNKLITITRNLAQQTLNISFARTDMKKFIAHEREHHKPKPQRKAQNMHARLIS